MKLGGCVKNIDQIETGEKLSEALCFDEVPSIGAILKFKFEYLNVYPRLVGEYKVAVRLFLDKKHRLDWHIRFILLNNQNERSDLPIMLFLDCIFGNPRNFRTIPVTDDNGKNFSIETWGCPASIGDYIEIGDTYHPVKQITYVQGESKEHLKLGIPTIFKHIANPSFVSNLEMFW